MAAVPIDTVDQNSIQVMLYRACVDPIFPKDIVCWYFLEGRNAMRIDPENFVERIVPLYNRVYNSNINLRSMLFLKYYLVNTLGFEYKESEQGGKNYHLYYHPDFTQDGLRTSKGEIRRIHAYSRTPAVQTPVIIQRIQSVSTRMPPPPPRVPVSRQVPDRIREDPRSRQVPGRLLPNSSGCLREDPCSRQVQPVRLREAPRSRQVQPVLKRQNAMCVPQSSSRAQRIQRTVPTIPQIAPSVLVSSRAQKIQRTVPIIPQIAPSAPVSFRSVVQREPQEPQEPPVQRKSLKPPVQREPPEPREPQVDLDTVLKKLWELANAGEILCWTSITSKNKMIRVTIKDRAEMLKEFPMFPSIKCFTKFIRNNGGIVATNRFMIISHPRLHWNCVYKTLEEVPKKVITSAPKRKRVKEKDDSEPPKKKAKIDDVTITFTGPPEKVMELLKKFKQ